jgi:hypothetical protein
MVMYVSKFFCKQPSVPYGRHFDVVLYNLRVREVRAEIFGNCLELFSLSTFFYVICHTTSDSSPASTEVNQEWNIVLKTA